VAFTFEPQDLLKGLYISLAVAIGLAVFGAWVLLGWLRGRRTPASPS
jgi:hypothetical protein